MFGTIVTNPKEMDKEAQARYGAWYCGLCHRLDVQFGSVGCASLTYDMTFVDILLSALYECTPTEGSQHCAPHPLKKHPFLWTQATVYAADMNMALAYYQALDDWNDDRNRVAKEKARMIEGFLPDIRTRWPRQCAVMEECLALLGEMERQNELNPDLPANCFGELMAELFVWRPGKHEETLRHMGAALGRYVYLLDAVNDLKQDIKKQRYNPLVAQMDTDFTPILTMMMAECTAAFETLPIDAGSADGRILENVLYSGVWQSYRKRNGKAEDDDAGPV